eukprot:1175522-Prorocentrum_minimum.AAC.2
MLDLMFVVWMAEYTTQCKNEESCENRVAQRDGEKLEEVLRAQAVLGVEKHSPAKTNKEGGHGEEQERLVLQPQCLQTARLHLAPVGDSVVEGQQRKGFQVDVMLKLLWCRMMLVMLVPPPGARHSAANSVNNLLQTPVNRDLPSKAVMTALVH